jgi:adenylate kinase
MVSRLNSYATEYSDLFERVLDVIQSEFSHILRRQSLTGVAIIRSQNPLLENPIALNMCLDVLTERGFTVVLDVVKVQVPSHLDPIVPGDVAGPKIICRTEKTLIFRLEWQKPSIQRNE